MKTLLGSPSGLSASSGCQNRATLTISMNEKDEIFRNRCSVDASRSEQALCLHTSTQSAPGDMFGATLDPTGRASACGEKGQSLLARLHISSRTVVCETPPKYTLGAMQPCSACPMACVGHGSMQRGPPHPVCWHPSAIWWGLLPSLHTMENRALGTGLWEMGLWQLMSSSKQALHLCCGLTQQTARHHAAIYSLPHNGIREKNRKVKLMG